MTVTDTPARATVRLHLCPHATNNEEILTGAEVVSAVRQVQQEGGRVGLLLEFPPAPTPREMLAAIAAVLDVPGVTALSVCSLTMPGPGRSPDPPQ